MRWVAGGSTLAGKLVTGELVLVAIRVWLRETSATDMLLLKKKSLD
jgi:hypothetical protein